MIFIPFLVTFHAFYVRLTDRAMRDLISRFVFTIFHTLWLKLLFAILQLPLFFAANPILLLTLKAPRKNASENVVCLSRLLQIIA